jgi:hypothetical protein
MKKLAIIGANEFQKKLVLKIGKCECKNWNRISSIRGGVI